jgi:acetyl esterase/lipase
MCTAAACALRCVRAAAACARHTLVVPVLLLSWSLRLLFYLGAEGGAHAVCVFIPRFILLALALIPAAPHLLAALFSKRATLFVKYAKHRRADYDVVLPAGGAPRAVVVLIPGGAWIIGHKYHTLSLVDALLAARCAVVMTDLRMFPVALASAQAADVRDSLAAVARALPGWRADSRRVYALAHSAGANLLALALLDAAERGAGALGLRRALLVSGAYDIAALRPHVIARGLPAALLNALFERDDARFSPTGVVARLAAGGRTAAAVPRRPVPPRAAGLAAALFRTSSTLLLATGRALAEAEGDLVIEATAPPAARAREGPSPACLSALPPLHVHHGVLDATICVSQARAFVAALAAAGVAASLHEHAADTHTSLVLEGPLSGECAVVEALLAAVAADEAADGAAAAATPPRARRAAPLSRWYAHCVRRINPF